MSIYCLGESVVYFKLYELLDQEHAGEMYDDEEPIFDVAYTIAELLEEGAALAKMLREESSAE